MRILYLERKNIVLVGVLVGLKKLWLAAW